MRLIVLTHWHIDHVGSAAELRRLTGAQVAIHELDASVLAGGELPLVKCPPFARRGAQDRRR